jgi:hypothetical protein
VNFGEHDKSSGQHSLTSLCQRSLTVSLAKGWLRLCANLVKGFIRVYWRGFQGDGWPRFDQRSVSLTRLDRSLALMTVIKNLGRHNPIASRAAAALQPAAPPPLRETGSASSPYTVDRTARASPRRLRRWARPRTPLDFLLRFCAVVEPLARRSTGAAGHQGHRHHSSLPLSVLSRGRR